MQRLWRHLVPPAAGAQAQTQTLQASDLLRFMAQALQPAPAVDTLEDEEGAVAADSSPRPLDDPTLLADFAALYRNTLSYKSTRNVRSSAQPSSNKSRLADHLPST